MNADVFVDTNILLYTIDEDPASAGKRQRTQQLPLSERWAGRSRSLPSFSSMPPRRNDRFGSLMPLRPRWWMRGLHSRHSN